MMLQRREIIAAKFMALFTTVRRLQLQRLHPFTSLLPCSFSLPDQLIPSLVLRPPLSALVSRAFHQTHIRQFKSNHNFSIHRRVRWQYLDHLINFDEYRDETSEDIQSRLHEILERVNKAKDFDSGDEAIAFLDDCGVKPNTDFIFSLIWALKDEWKLAYLVFKWGENWDCVVEKTWCLMIWLLGKHKKFSTAWTLIRELYVSSKDNQQAMLILIDRYAAGNYPDKAIRTFHLMEKFKFSPDQRTYFSFLSILCKHGNEEEAEEFMYLNKKFFPLETESFNIILNGWCNIAVDIYEAKRVWREMSKNCIEQDGMSYTHMISCYSEVSNLFESLRLYDEMKKRGWVTGVEVYHSLIYVLTRENCLNEALKIIDKMKETGLKPNSTTYNSIIRPLCEAVKFEEARTILSRMMEDGISPNIDTYHALLEGEDIEGTLGVLDHMRRADCGPNKDTFLLILLKLFKSSQPENALKIWSEMQNYAIEPDRTHYIILVEGLAKCSLIVKAREFYTEMTSHGLADDPSLKKLLQEPTKAEVRARKRKGQMEIVRHVKRDKGLRRGKTRVERKGNRTQSEKKSGSRT